MKLCMGLMAVTMAVVSGCGGEADNTKNFVGSWTSGVGTTSSACDGNPATTTPVAAGDFTLGITSSSGNALSLALGGMGVATICTVTGTASSESAASLTVGENCPLPGGAGNYKTKTGTFMYDGTQLGMVWEIDSTLGTMMCTGSISATFTRK